MEGLTNYTNSMKHIITTTLAILLVLGLVGPTSALARERQERDTGRDTTTEQAPENNDGEDGQDGGDGTSGSHGDSSVVVTNSVVISTHSGNQSESGEAGSDGITTGGESASASIETIVNGEVVQDINVNGEDVLDQRRSLRESRTRERFEDEDGGVIVDTDVTIENNEYSEENDTGNQNNDGEDGQDGADGQDGSAGEDVTPDPDPQPEEEESSDRRDRGERNLGNRLSVAGMFDRISNFFNNALGFFFA